MSIPVINRSDDPIAAMRQPSVLAQRPLQPSKESAFFVGKRSRETHHGKVKFHGYHWIP